MEYIFYPHKCTKRLTGHRKTELHSAQKLQEEVEEVLSALVEYQMQPTDWNKRVHLMMEIMDVIHVCETLLRLMNTRDSERNLARNLVIEKNDQRGYYD